MAGAGHRYPLILYAHTLKRWWKFTLWIGIILLVLAVGMRVMALEFPDAYSLPESDETLWGLVGAGAYAILLSIFLATISKYAYVQPYPTHLRLITPFLRMNISYRRIRQASSVDMKHLFPIGQYKGWRWNLMRPLAGQTAIVLEMRGWPMPHQVLNLFLSPFFFPDKTSRLALLVPKWMDFSMEMESFRTKWLDSQHETENNPQSILLASLANPKK